MTDNNTASHCLERLAAASVTPQHERITDMLLFYGVNGIIELTEEQIVVYTCTTLGKETVISSGETAVERENKQ